LAQGQSHAGPPARRHPQRVALGLRELCWQMSPEIPNRPPARRPTEIGLPPNIDDKIHHAQSSPAPNAYEPRRPRHFESKPGGKISDSQVPAPLDAPARMNAFVPGPGSYSTPDLRDFALPEGGRLSRKPPAPVDQYNIKELENPRPAPGAYGIPNDPTRPVTNAGKFSKYPKYSKFIRDVTQRSRHIPGPGAHEVLEAQDNIKPFCPEGGRCLMASKPVGYFDKAAKLTEGNPAPTSYDLQGSIQHKGKGQLVWRYESASLDESRKLVDGAVGGNSTAPGPGAYTPHDPPALAQAPTMRGRTVAHGMPHPFAYNCQPDLSRKFEPVRQQNSGSMIYGRDMKRVSGSTKLASRSQPSLLDRVSTQEMLVAAVGPGQVGELDDPVQWRSGGFSGVRKSKSSSALASSPPEHPCVENAMRQYPALARKDRDGSTFLPMSSKRSEPICTHDVSSQCKRLQRKKWELAAVAESIQSVATGVMEPLDEEKLKKDAMKGMLDKARERSTSQGISKDRQEILLREFSCAIEQVCGGGPSQG